MKKIGILSKPGKKESLTIIKELIPWLGKKHVKVYIDDIIAKSLNIKGYPRSEIPSLVDAIVVLGGDGTLLSVARLVADKGIPILGVNLGGLGFITEVKRTEVFDAVGAMISNECKIEERIMLSAYLKRNNKDIAEHTALNDIVITGGAPARIIDIETFIDNKYLTTFKSDGLIVSTPTGSTAYSLSAGGPILYPGLNCILITPICPHTLTNRPIVIDDKMSLRIILRSISEDVFLTVDGQIGLSLKKDDVIEVKKAEFKTILLIPFKRDYFQVLREKLKWGER